MTILVLNGKKRRPGRWGDVRPPAWRDKVGRILEALAQDMGARWDDALSGVNFPMEFSRYRREKTRPSRKLMAIKVARDRHVIIRDPDEHAMRGRCPVCGPCKAQDTQ
jgi:hypothetical protein